MAQKMLQVLCILPQRCRGRLHCTYMGLALGLKLSVWYFTSLDSLGLFGNNSRKGFPVYTVEVELRYLSSLNGQDTRPKPPLEVQLLHLNTTGSLQSPMGPALSSPNTHRSTFQSTSVPNSHWSLQKLHAQLLLKIWSWHPLVMYVITSA